MDHPARASLIKTENGLVPEERGWYTANIRDVEWGTVEGGGAWCVFGTDDPEPQQLGIGVHVLWPGDRPGFYHAESAQEGFLVLAGECTLIVDGEERTLRQWDYFHCAADTPHITVGAGDGPCAILMIGARVPGKTIVYPVDATAAKHGASVEKETTSPKEAYADRPPIRTARAPWPSGDG